MGSGWWLPTKWGSATTPRLNRSGSVAASPAKRQDRHPNPVTTSCDKPTNEKDCCTSRALGCVDVVTKSMHVNCSLLLCLVLPLTLVSVRLAEMTRGSFAGRQVCIRSVDELPALTHRDPCLHTRVDVVEVHVNGLSTAWLCQRWHADAIALAGGGCNFAVRGRQNDARPYDALARMRSTRVCAGRETSRLTDTIWLCDCRQAQYDTQIRRT